MLKVCIDPRDISLNLACFHMISINKIGCNWAVQFTEGLSNITLRLIKHDNWSKQGHKPANKLIGSFIRCKGKVKLERAMDVFPRSIIYFTYDLLLGLGLSRSWCKYNILHFSCPCQRLLTGPNHNAFYGNFAYQMPSLFFTQAAKLESFKFYGLKDRY